MIFFSETIIFSILTQYNLNSITCDLEVLNFKNLKPQPWLDSLYWPLYFQNQLGELVLDVVTFKSYHYVFIIK